MNQTNSFQQKIRQFLMILLPILVTQLSLCAMNFFDTMMSGHAGTNDLAGVAIGSSIWLPVFTGLNGILLAVTPILAQLLGARRTKDVPFIVIQGIYLALAISMVVIISGTFTLTPLLKLMELEPGVYEVARQYLIAMSLGIAPLFIYTVLRCFIDTLGYTRVTMLITLTTLPINILLNYILIFGKLGLPRLGGVGAGYASAMTYWIIALLSLFVIQRVPPFRNYHVLNQRYGVSFTAWKEQLKIGVPIGTAIFCETSIFAVVTLLMSQFDTATIAAHQAALSFSSLVYMIPLSITLALTIAVGFEAGAKRFKDAKQYSYLGIGTGLIVAVFGAAFLFVFNEQVAGLYTEDPAVLRLTQQFLLYAAFFQLSDAVAAPIQGSLRGYKDVTMTFIMALVSYWMVGLPLGYMLANFSSYGAFGYWIGLIAGLATGAVVLSARLARVQETASIS